MTLVKPELRRLSQLPESEDPHHLAELFRSAKAAPDEELPRLRWRLRVSQRQRVTRARRFVHVAMTTGVVFLTGGVVGAVVGHYWKVQPSVPVPNAEPSAKPVPKAARKAKAAAPPSEATPVEPSLSDPPADERMVEPKTVSVEPKSVRIASATVPQRLAAPRVPTAPSPPVPTTTTAAPLPVAQASPVALEHALLGDVLKLLRQHRDPNRALALLQDHTRRFPDTVLAPEAAMLRVEAQLALGRNAEALAELDRLSLGAMPNQEERFALRGELRAAAGRWREARNDFERALGTAPSAGMDAKARDVKERALWGRASARSYLGDAAGARADLEAYLRFFPAGRFAQRAAALLKGSP